MVRERVQVRVLLLLRNPAASEHVCVHGVPRGHARLDGSAAKRPSVVEVLAGIEPVDAGREPETELMAGPDVLACDEATSFRED